MLLHGHDGFNVVVMFIKFTESFPKELYELVNTFKPQEGRGGEGGGEGEEGEGRGGRS